MTDEKIEELAMRMFAKYYGFRHKTVKGLQDIWKRYANPDDKQRHRASARLAAEFCAKEGDSR